MALIEKIVRLSKELKLINTKRFDLSTCSCGNVDTGLWSVGELKPPGCG